MRRRARSPSRSGSASAAGSRRAGLRCGPRRHTSSLSLSSPERSPARSSSSPLPVTELALCLLIVALAVAVRPRFLGAQAQRLLARRGIELPALLRGRELAAVSALNTLGWIATGGGAWLLVRALTGAGDSNFLSLTAAYAFAWLLGFLVPLLPGGLGIREATLVALLAPTYGVGVATTLSLALRLANTLGEFTAIAAVEAGNQTQSAIRRARAQGPSRSS
jgi:uncharacterized membrane protein YbhN (UPF0104 family)